MMALEMDTDYLTYEIGYIRKIENGRVRCCGHDWAADKLRLHNGETVRVVLRDSYGGRFVAVESLQYQYITTAQRVV